MLRFLYVIIMNLFRAPFMISKMRYEADRPDKFSEKRRYRLNQQAVRIKAAQRLRRVHTVFISHIDIEKYKVKPFSASGSKERSAGIKTQDYSINEKTV